MLGSTRMPLAPATRLGPYEILRAIGASDMSACGPASERERVEPSWRGGGAPRNFLKMTDLAHAGVASCR